MSVVHVCDFSHGPWRYFGWYFEFHEICGPVELRADGETKQWPPSTAFLAVWEIFDRLPQAEKDLYAATW